MGFLDSLKANNTATKAFRIHQEAVKVSESGKPAEAKEKYAQALSLYEQALEQGLARPSTLCNYAVLLMREGQLEKAREVMLKIEKLPGLTKDDWYQLRLDFSLYQWKSGQLDKAIETIRRASATMNGTLYNTLGMYLLDKAEQTGDFAEALSFNQEALEYDDEDASTLDNMGQLYLRMSKAAESKEEAADCRAKALDYLKKAYKAKPRQITSKYYLATLLHEDGEDEKARKVMSDLDTLYISAMCPVTKEMLEALNIQIG